jgi:NAD(P)-dependent dehydrogenase (short-subunit alcohol dehydrogenase family)
MSLSSFDLRDRVAVVTGAAGKRGIGRATALTLAEAGADVVVCDINVTGADFDLEGTAEAVRKFGRRSKAIRMDISDQKDVNDSIESIVKEFGSIDIMVNNAAAAGMMPWTEVKQSHWEKLFNTNVIGCHNCCCAVSRIMMENKKGSIVNISSTTGVAPVPPFYAYGVSKAAVNQITITLASELARYNIRVNGVAPGMIATDISTHDFVNPGSFESRKKILGRSLNDDNDMNRSASEGLRIGSPDDIANAVLFLASDASKFVSGRIIIVDGGIR